MANRAAISEALNTLAKGVKVQKEEKKNLKENLNKKKSLNESFKYEDLIDDLAGRVDDPTDEDDIFEAIDSGLIYSEDLWTAIEEICSPNEVMDCLAEKGIDVFAMIYEDVLKRLEDKDLTESCKNEECTKEECQTCEAAEVKDQVEVRTNEPGFIGKMHELRDKGYKCVSGRPEKGGKVMVFVKEEPLQEAKTSPEDQADSDVIRDVAKRSWDRRNAKISKAEQDVLDKHGIVRDSDTYKHGTLLKDLGNGQKRFLTGPNGWTNNPNKDSEKMNYADRARKIDKRDYAKRVNQGGFRGDNFGERERSQQAYDMSQPFYNMRNALRDREYAKDNLARKDDPEEYHNKEIAKAQRALDDAKRLRDSSVNWNKERLQKSQDEIDTLLKRK